LEEKAKNKLKTPYMHYFTFKVCYNMYRLLFL